MSSRKPGDSGERVLLGRITGAHGLKGEVRIAAFTAEPEDVAAYGPLQNADGSVTVEIASLRPVGDGAVVARLAGIADRTAAERLRGIELYVPREKLPLAGADEYYYSDLIGLAVFSPEGEALGEVVAVHNFGAGDLVEVRAPQGRQTTLIPFESAHVPKVDLEAGRVTIILPVYENDKPDRE
jgi:16S rRNA processing protein RimM